MRFSRRWRRGGGKRQRAELEGKIEAVLKRLSAAEVNELVPDGGEFTVIADAVKGWYALLLDSRVVDLTSKRVVDVLCGSMLVLGTLVKHTYASGVRAGRCKNDE
jgi:hypothetical protein